MDPRKERKEQTRQHLLAVATDMLASGRSFDSLSLREVAKQAGIAPTSFYRHFHDLEDLGLAVIDEHGKGLFAVMENVRRDVSRGQSLIRASVEAVYSFVADNLGVARMIVQESMSPESPFCDGSKTLFKAMGKELSDYLEEEARERQVPVGYPRLAASAMVSIMFTSGVAMLNSPEADRERAVDAATIKLKMIMLGAETLGAEAQGGRAVSA